MAAARFTHRLVLPTPPFPEAMAMIDGEPVRVSGQAGALALDRVA